MADSGTLSKPKVNGKLTISKKSEAKYVPGRRAFFKYRELGVTDGTSGAMRAQVTTAISAMDRETGWHYHTCDTQFVYMLRGWVDLEFEGAGVVRLEAGDSVMIPGGLPHQEIRTSEDFEILELSVPAEMGTVACDKPA
ncbi:MAG TPA: cupin domain-containing protein [Stellaceae bacterium]|nr:cupin domain-containing protein [Stellaceae bacterium]